MRDFLYRKKQGFTLIELIVVIAIIGVLMAILIPSLIGYIQTAKVRQAETNAKTAYNAATAYVAGKETKDDFVVLAVDANSVVTAITASNGLLGGTWAGHVNVEVIGINVTHACWFKDTDPGTFTYEHEDGDGAWAAYPLS